MARLKISLVSCVVLGTGLVLWPSPEVTPTTAAALNHRKPDRSPSTTVRVKSAPNSVAPGTEAQRAPHLLALPLPSTSTAAPDSQNLQLERALDEEGLDPAWTERVEDEVSEQLAEDPELDVEEVRCSQTLCRVRMTKPIASSLDWPEIDRLLAPIARGETIFTATAHGARTTGYLYFSADDANLPLSDVHAPDGDG